jgi:hypothetical protein
VLIRFLAASQQRVAVVVVRMVQTVSRRLTTKTDSLADQVAAAARAMVAHLSTEMALVAQAHQAKELTVAMVKVRMM